MRILHTYTNDRLEDQVETKRAISQLEHRYGYVVESVQCLFPWSYWSYLAGVWGLQDLILIEQDIVPEFYHISHLADCGFEACTVPYRVSGHWSIGWSTYDIDMQNSAVGPTGPTGLGILQPTGTQWFDDTSSKLAPVSAFGLVKISKGLQERIDIHKYPVPEQHWSLLDTWFSAYMNVMEGLDWHVHLPSVKHNHNAKLTPELQCSNCNRVFYSTSWVRCPSCDSSVRPINH